MHVHLSATVLGSIRFFIDWLQQHFVFTEVQKEHHTDHRVSSERKRVIIMPHFILFPL